MIFFLGRQTTNLVIVGLCLALFSVILVFAWCIFVMVMQSLTAELDSKQADLQAFQERCQSKDEQLAALGQQMEQLQSMVEAQKQSYVERHQRDSHPWAVDVSLDQGVGLGPGHMVPSSPTALRHRVQTLEVCLHDAILCYC